MAYLANLTGQSESAVLNNTQIQLFLDNGSSCDYTVRKGIIGGMSNGTALTGSGGYITPDANFDETTETGDAPLDATANELVGSVYDTVSTPRTATVGTPDNASAPVIAPNPESALGPVTGSTTQAKGPEAVSLNQVRFDGQALKVNHVNGDTVLYICVITSDGDIVGKYVS